MEADKDVYGLNYLINEEDPLSFKKKKPSQTKLGGDIYIFDLDKSMKNASGEFNLENYRKE